MRRIRSGCCARAKSGQAAADPATTLMNSRRLIASPREEGIVAVHTRLGKGPLDVRFGSKADICGATRHVRFTPNCDRESEFPHTFAVQLAMSALGQ
jgi:hypothetical protein